MLLIEEFKIFTNVHARTCIESSTTTSSCLGSYPYFQVDSPGSFHQSSLCFHRRVFHSAPDPKGPDDCECASSRLGTDNCPAELRLIISTNKSGSLFKSYSGNIQFNTNNKRRAAIQGETFDFDNDKETTRINILRVILWHLSHIPSILA